MKVLMRKTISGNEYWDTKDKRTLFVPKGEKPEFQVAESVDSMNGKAKDMGKVTADNSKETAGALKQLSEDDGINPEDLNTEQLLSFAEHNDIDVPGNMKKKDTIRKHIEDQLTDDKQ